MKSSILLLFTLFLSIAYGQGNSVLWELSGNDLKGKSYLYGTIHAPINDFLPLDTAIVNRLNAVQTVTGELDFREVEKSLLVMATSISLPQGVTLKDCFTDTKRYYFVKQQSDSILGIETPDFKPFYILGLLQELSLKGNPNDTIMDDYFQKKALVQNKEVIALESIKEQLAAVDSIPLQEQAAVLYDYLTEEENVDILALYKQQNLALINEYMQEDSKFKQTNKFLFYERNKRMTNRIIALSKRRETFHTFGAAHLIEKEVIFELLSNKVYIVTPVRITF